MGRRLFPPLRQRGHNKEMPRRQPPGDHRAGGHGRRVADNLEVKEVWVGDGERRKRYVLCFNPQEAERQRQHGAGGAGRGRCRAVVAGQARGRSFEGSMSANDLAPLRSLSQPRWARRPKMDAAKVKAAEKFDGRFVVGTNDGTLSEEDVALANWAGAMIESYFRRMQHTGLEVRPIR
jgi:hypothetical protein